MAVDASDVFRSCAIAVMAKASEAGQVKTRLSPPLQPVEAAELNTAFLRDIVANLQAAQLSSAISPWMAYAPKGSAAFFETHLPSGVGLLEAVAPTFDACLLNTITALLEKGYASACVLNADSPTLPPAYLVTAATVLAADGDRAVLGPSTDGGYYLLGLKHPHRRLFEDIAWSTERVCAQTLERCADIGLPVVMLPPWYDVDDAASLDLLAGEVFEGRAPLPNVGARRGAAHASQQWFATHRAILTARTAFETRDAIDGAHADGAVKAAP